MDNICIYTSDLTQDSLDMIKNNLKTRIIENIRRNALNANMSVKDYLIENHLKYAYISISKDELYEDYNYFYKKYVEDKVNEKIAKTFPICI